MPNCFTLTPKGSKEPESLAKIDEAICNHLGIPIHPTKYVEDWYDYLGFGLAMGKTFPELAERFRDDPPLLKIAQFLDEHYTADVWAEIGRR